MGQRNFTLSRRKWLPQAFFMYFTSSQSFEPFSWIVQLYWSAERKQKEESAMRGNKPFSLVLHDTQNIIILCLPYILWISRAVYLFQVLEIGKCYKGEIWFSAITLHLKRLRRETYIIDKTISYFCWFWYLRLLPKKRAVSQTELVFSVGQYLIKLQFFGNSEKVMITMQKNHSAAFIWTVMS